MKIFNYLLKTLFFYSIFLFYYQLSIANVDLLNLPPSRLSSADIPDVNDGQDFGNSVAIYKDILAIGARNDNAEGPNTGAVFIYQRNPNDNQQWNFVKKLIGSDTNGSDQFGYAVAIDQGVLVVGAPFRNDENPVGAVYIFYRNLGGADNWGEHIKLKGEIDNNENNFFDGFGFAVDIENDVLVVGSPYDALNGVPSAGSAYVFYRDQDGDDAWGQVIKRALPSINIDLFGWSVSLSGNRVAVGAPQAGGIADGRVILLERDWSGPDTWDFEKFLRGANSANGDEFGYAVALDNDVVAVTAPFRNLIISRGLVFIYYQDEEDQNDNFNDQWGLKADVSSFFMSDIFNFGGSLSLKNNILAIGSPFQGPVNTPNIGAVTVHKKDNGGVDLWGKEGETLLANDFQNFESSSPDEFGYAVALSDTELVVGARNNDADGNNGVLQEGSVYIYSVITDLFSDGFENN